MKRKTYKIAGLRSARIFERTGEFRPPKAGEWFLSGAIPEAYQAILDMESTSYYIVQEVVNRRWHNRRRTP